MEFDAILAKQYDSGIRRTLPTYDSMLRLIQTFLRANVSDPGARLLVVGAGGGNEVIGFGSNNPEWTFTGVDPSEGMLAVAKQKCDEVGLSGRVTLVQGTVEDICTETTFNAATCILVLHFIQSYEDKLKTLKEIHARLKHAAPFVLVSKYGDPTSAEFQERLKLWKSYWLDTTKLNVEEVDKMEQDILSLSYVTEEGIEQLLQEAGFVRVAKFFSTTLFGGWICHKL
ncbi:class I SAM-dependent methyltransferase [Bacillus sp. FJAT-22090]|uniref:class I SAM-dependent methyltransferase n=1 Tax=Bacillus sp. FJAT-22090 TaxID=1581038 RepID=UPI0011A996FD|nr:class I SAM-dependent methyltransferase [Bacillus sp. FJAT-22090]